MHLQILAVGQTPLDELTALPKILAHCPHPKNLFPVLSLGL